jgi:hypothetical protein
MVLHAPLREVGVLSENHTLRRGGEVCWMERTTSRARARKIRHWGEGIEVGKSYKRFFGTRQPIFIGVLCRLRRGCANLKALTPVLESVFAQEREFPEGVVGAFDKFSS